MVHACLDHNAIGEPCRAQPVRPSGYCWWHDPQLAEERARKRRAGGVTRGPKARAKQTGPTASMTSEELLARLTLVFKGVINGRIAPARGASAAAIARTMIQVREVSELEERLRVLEEAAGFRGPGRRA